MKTLNNIKSLDKIATNSTIDSILGGGIEKGTITQIYGPPASGKTNIALTLAVEVSKNSRKVLYIDTEGGISIERVKQIAKDNFDVVAENLIVFEPKSFKSQQMDLRAIEHWLNDNHDDVDLIVIDSIVALYRSNEKAIKESNRDMGKQIALLTRLSREYPIAILITNQIYSSFDSEGNNNNISPVGGFTLQYGSKTIVELAKTNEIGQRIATIKRHRTIAEGIATNFNITGNGIE
ncbi:MAG: DNA repair and recombination protein RadB [Methanobrevibacter sp.]|jgi:DNA repair protein RadB|nr:DNA repair and recombination protein RadB [Candidatus Methanoflexus mossambicus]